MQARRWGRLLSINTVGIHQPALTYHGYTAAKTAMLGLTRNLAVEVGQYNITVNIVSPGLTLTEEVRARLSPEEQERRAQQIPLRRIGRVEDTANVALFLASELGSFVTGLYIPVCGGQVME
jgi:3-oxoacyl-[acyl-carrier protein] reductase